jgi:hypothetical protein
MKPQRNAPLEETIMGFFDAPIRLKMTDVCSTLRARNAVKAYISPPKTYLCPRSDTSFREDPYHLPLGV